MNIDWKEYIDEKLKDPNVKSFEIYKWDASGYDYGRPALPIFKIEKFDVDEVANGRVENKLKDGK